MGTIGGRGEIVKVKGVFVILPFFISCIFSVSGWGSQNNESISHIINKFAANLYKYVLDGEGNVFFSPYSLSSAFAMLYPGARGKTKEEMEKVLHFIPEERGNSRQFHVFLNRIREINRDGKIDLITANSIWLQKGVRLLESYLGTVKRFFESGLHYVDFIASPEGARKAINRWVAKKTRDKIKDLLHRGDVTQETRMVLCNAIYFNGKWKKAFDRRKTKKGIFYEEGRKKKEVEMMEKEEECRLAELGQIDAISIPYGKGEVSMIIFLPKDRDGIEMVDKGIEGGKLEEWISTVLDSPTKEVRVVLPKFKMEERYDLGQVLEKMGMKTSFSSQADFSGLAGERRWAISKVVHKAVVEVDEKGTEAAAATAVVVEEITCLPSHQNFVADHPFVFAIVDTKTGSILFLGRMTTVKS